MNSLINISFDSGLRGDRGESGEAGLPGLYGLKVNHIVFFVSFQ